MGRIVPRVQPDPPQKIVGDIEYNFMPSKMPQATRDEGVRASRLNGRDEFRLHRKSRKLKDEPPRTRAEASWRPHAVMHRVTPKRPTTRAFLIQQLSFARPALSNAIQLQNCPCEKADWIEKRGMESEPPGVQGEKRIVRKWNDAGPDAGPKHHPDARLKLAHIRHLPSKYCRPLQSTNLPSGYLRRPLPSCSPCREATRRTINR